MRNQFSIAASFALFAGAVSGCASGDDSSEPPPALNVSPALTTITHPSQVGAGKVSPPLSPPLSNRDPSPAYLREEMERGSPEAAAPPPLFTPGPTSVDQGPPPEATPSATLYPTRGHAALASDSPTLYPARGVIVPPGSATLYPRGPAGPTGFVGH
jgi:hypothetical protein